jgi:very-short-patch-repair endonuclease
MTEAHRPYRPYRVRLKANSRSLRKDPTPAERRLWYDFLRGLPQKFTRQKPLGHYIADFYCSSSRLVIEVDGDSHFCDEGVARDAVRSESLRGMGLRVIRLSNTDVMQSFEAVCMQVMQALEEQS